MQANSLLLQLSTLSCSDLLWSGLSFLLTVLLCSLIIIFIFIIILSVPLSIERCDWTVIHITRRLYTEIMVAAWKEAVTVDGVYYLCMSVDMLRNVVCAYHKQLCGR